MRIVVFGAGAMGSFIGGLLSARHEVTLVARPDHVNAIRARGLRITGKTVMLAKPAASPRVPRGARPEIVIVATKSYDTGSAMTHLRPFARSALFLTLQNGLGNAEEIARTAGRVVAGTTAHGVTYLGPGEIRHAGAGDTVVGPWAHVDERDLVLVRDLLEDVGMPTRIVSDTRTELWAKAIVNAGINPVAALAGVPNGRLARDPRLRALVEAVVREAAEVAKAQGIPLDARDLARRTILVARRTAENRCSMLQDLDRGRRTEIDAITGAIVAAGQRHRVPTLLNAALEALVRAKEAASRSSR